MCCGALQCVAVCYSSVLQGVAVCLAVWCSSLQYVTRNPTLAHITPRSQCVAVCCSVLQCVSECCRVLQSVAVCCSRVMQYVAQTPIFNRLIIPHSQFVAVCHSVSQCVAVCHAKPDFEWASITPRSRSTHCNTLQHTVTLQHAATG